jgi:outer membrane protein
MKIWKTTILTMLLLAILSSSALAQIKIGTVDMGYLFTNYWKTKQAQTSIDDRRAQLAKDDKSMQDDLKKVTEEYQQLLQQANDQAISADERARRQQAADDKLKQLQERRTALEQYERGAATTLNDQKLRMREKILDAIQSTVASVAKAGGYTLVLDKAAQAISSTPVLAYSTPEIDLTAEVLKQLNAGAPIDTAGAASPVVSSPVPSLLLNTNSP